MFMFMTLKWISVDHSNTTKNMIQYITLNINALIAAHHENTAITRNQQIGGKQPPQELLIDSKYQDKVELLLYSDAGLIMSRI